MAPVDLLPGTGTIYYSTLPQYYLFTTNMKYNEANIKRIQTYMRNTEKYDGVCNDPDADVENWRSHWDIGFSRQSGQDGTKVMYYAAHGNFYLVSWFPPEGAGPYRNWTQYSNSFPYFPYKSKVDCLSTSRSEVPNVGCTQMAVQGDVIPDPTGEGIFMAGLSGSGSSSGSHPTGFTGSRGPSGTQCTLLLVLLFGGVVAVAVVGGAW